MRRLLLTFLLALGLATPAQAAISIANDHNAIMTKLGQKFVFHSRIENHSARAARGLVAHLNVVDLTGHTYVDPEDWSTHRTHYLQPIPAGGATRLPGR